MNPDLHSALWAELTAAGLIDGAPPMPLGGGNLDRHSLLKRSSWRAVRSDGTAVKLTVARDLTSYREHLLAFSNAVPNTGPDFLFHRHVGGLEIVGETFVAGRSLDHLTGSRDANLQSAAAGVADVHRRVRATLRRSSDAARLEEWNRWQAAFLDLPCWDQPAQRFLTNRVMPALQATLFSAEPTKGWVHGDFIDRNILIDDLGVARLIDTEFAAETHFTAVDEARFHALTAAAGKLAPFIASTLPPPGTATYLLFWLQQVERELASNSAEYVTRWLPVRLAEIRRLAESLVGHVLPDCPWTPLAPEYGKAEFSSIAFALEEARWLIESPCHALRFAGWCHRTATGPAVARVELLADSRRIGECEMQPRPDVQAHFGGNQSALQSGFLLEVPPVSAAALLSLVAVDPTGLRESFWSAPAGDLPGRGPLLCFYSSWAQLLDPDPPASAIGDVALTFSILLPVYKTPPDLLRACLDSVRAQHYPNWQLCVVDDGSADAQITSLLAEYGRADARIVVQTRPANGGIARATNDALAIATGQYVVLLDHDDLLRRHALTELARKLTAEPELDAVYSDEDKIDARGQRVRPMFKPGFSPEFLRGVMYVGHVLCVRTGVAKAVGGFDPAYDGIQDYEFMLRVSELTKRIGHIPRVLYHWRQSPSSSALLGNVKGDMDRRQIQAVQSHLQRLGQSRRAEALGGHRVRLFAARPAPAPDSVTEVRYGAFDPPLEALVRASMGNNDGVVLLVSDHARSLSDADRAELVSLASLEDSGCVAPVFVSPRQMVLESGCAFVNGSAQPIMLGFDGSGDGFNGTLTCSREVAAVSAWCVAVRHSVVREHARSATSWLGFCTQLTQSGLFNRVCAGVRVSLPFHWRDYPNPGQVDGAHADPYYNPHFATTAADYRLATHPTHLPRAKSPFEFRIESAIRERLTDGCLTVRGWCFNLDNHPVRITISAGDLTWATLSTESRPDVAATYPGFTDGRCGFAARLRLPTGNFSLSIDAAAGTEQLTLLKKTVHVPPGQAFRRWLMATPQTLLAFQMLAGPTQPPSSLRAEPPLRLRGRPSALRFTVVTPSFQHGEFLAEAIRSVLEQADVTCDYLVQDGGSTDRTADVLKLYGPRLHSWAATSDDGQADAIARAFARTTGRPDDLMAWINSDDFYLPGTLARVAAFFDAHPDVDVVYGHRVVVDEQSREIGRWFMPAHDDEVLRLNDFVPQETMFWRRRIWTKTGGIDPSFKFAMDWDLLLRFQAAGAKIVRLPYFLACFRVHSAQKTSAQLGSVGQVEIDALRLRTFGRVLSAAELESHPRLIRYLRQSAWIEFLWRTFRIRIR